MALKLILREMRKLEDIEQSSRKRAKIGTVL